MNTHRQNKFIAVIRKILDGQPVQMPSFFTRNEQQLFRETQGLREQYVKYFKECAGSDSGLTYKALLECQKDLEEANARVDEVTRQRDGLRAVAARNRKLRLTYFAEALRDVKATLRAAEPAPSRSKRRTRRLPRKSPSSRR